MGIRKYKPVTPSTRYKSVLDFAEITEEVPHKSLTKTITYKAARGFNGRITVRQRGGRVKRKYRSIDFKRFKRDIPAIVKSIEYDPNRSAFIALLCYTDGEYTYILAPEGLKVGDKVSAGKSAEIKIGNSLPLDKIPPGTNVHNMS